MLLLFFIRPITFSQMIIDWNQIGFLNYLRAIIYLIGCSFIPGSCFYNIITSKDSLPERFDIEPFIIKITIYPLLSFILLGFLTFILDFFGLISNFYSISLLVFIIILFFLEIYIQKHRKKIKVQFKRGKIRISRPTFLILFLSLGIIIIATGIYVSSIYLIPGDNWRGIKYAYYIGQPNTNSYTKFYGGYTMYWGYISYSLGSLCGLPFININALLFPFLYLFATSVYLFTKALLREYNKIYSILSTFTIVTFSGLFYIFNSRLAINSKLIAVGLFEFSYHSFAFFCLFLSLSLFVIFMKSNVKNKKVHSLKQEKNIISFLIALFLFHSYIIYFLPFIAGFLFILIYSIMYAKKKDTFRILLRIWLIFIILFVSLDIISTFYFSYIPLNYLYYFFNIPRFDISNKNVLIYNALLIYTIFICSYILLYLIFKLRFKVSSSRISKKINIKNKYITPMILSFFTILLGIEIIFNLIFSIEKNFFLFCLDILFLNIGIIGIFGIYFSYQTFKLNKKLFFLLLLWFFFIFGIASLLLFRNWIKFFPMSPTNIPIESYYYMMYWFTRNWYISSIPLAIFFSIGLIKLINYFRWQASFKYRSKNLKLMLSLMLISSFVIFALSNTFTSGIYWSDKYDANNTKPLYISNEEAQIMGWVSDNIPPNSDILIDRYLLYHLIDIAFCPTYFIWNELKEAEENYNGWYSEYDTPPNCNLELMENLDGKNKILSLYDNNPDGNVKVEIFLNSNFTTGSIEFYSRYSDESKYTYLVGKNNDGTIGFHIGANDEGFGYYNGTDWNYIYAYQSNIWFHHKLNFYYNEGSIGVFEWYINGILISDNCTFQSDSKFLNYIELGTGWTDSGGFYFWIDSFNITTTSILENLENEILTISSDIAINHFKSKDIKIFIVNRWNLLTYNKLIERYFNRSLYQYGNLLIYKSV